MIYKLKKVDCRENPVRLKNVSCRLKPINWNVAMVNMDCDLFIPIVRPVVSCEFKIKLDILAFACRFAFRSLKRITATSSSHFLST